MSSDPGPSSPFAARARTRAPFSTPAPGAPAPAAPPPTATPTAGGKTTWIGIGLAVLAACVPATVLLTRRETRAVAPMAMASPPPTAHPASNSTAPEVRDSAAEYSVLSELCTGLDLPAADRPDVASATLLAAAGSKPEAVALLGPIVWRAINEKHASAMRALAGVKLSDHAAVPEVARWLDLTSGAEKAAAATRWAAAAQALAEATRLAPVARTGVVRRLATEAAAAASRGDLPLATFFYEQVIRLDPSDTAARAHLYRHRHTAGQRLTAAAGIEIVYAPPGEFTRGSRPGEPGRDADETQAVITLTRGFFIGSTEVTQRQWDAVYGAGSAARVIRSSPTRSQAIGPELPMHSITWEEATAFCERLGSLDGRRVRLPTEAEWEYACRAGSASAFNTGRDSLSATEANLDDGGATALLAPAPVGATGAPNTWGLRDAHGNVWEWCADWSAPYPAGPQSDPTGPEDAAAGRVDLAMRIVRGGGWNAPASEARCANRWEHSPAAVTGYLGFRVVIEPNFAAP